MASVFRSFTWWKIVLGAVLIYRDTYDLLYPSKRAFPPANPGEANVMLGLDVLFIGIGVWLLYSGIRVGPRKPMTFSGSPFRWLRNKRGHTPEVQAERNAPRVTKFSITRAPETPVDPRDHTVIIPRRRFVPETTITAPFECLAENTYRLEEGFLCGPFLLVM